MTVLCSRCGEVAPHCAACLERAVYWHTGTAAARGALWGARVRRRRPGEVWPAWEASERVRARAREIVADLGRDGRVVEALARACAEAAARAYAGR